MAKKKYKGQSRASIEAEKKKSLSDIEKTRRKLQAIDGRELESKRLSAKDMIELNKAIQDLEKNKALIEDKLEPALHWALQLFLSGIINPLWSKLISIACKSINIYNPKLPEFICNKNIQWEYQRTFLEDRERQPWSFCSAVGMNESTEKINKAIEADSDKTGYDLDSGKNTSSPTPSSSINKSMSVNKK
jgi:hypothetical protein